MHIDGDTTYVLEGNAEASFPDEIANIWLKSAEITLVDDGAKDAEIERLKAENEKLKKRRAKKVDDE